MLQVILTKMHLPETVVMEIKLEVPECQNQVAHKLMEDTSMVELVEE